jgi:hypothetical protein
MKGDAFDFLEAFKPWVWTAGEVHIPTLQLQGLKLGLEECFGRHGHGNPKQDPRHAPSLVTKAFISE